MKKSITKRQELNKANAANTQNLYPNLLYTAKLHFVTSQKQLSKKTIIKKYQNVKAVKK